MSNLTDPNSVRKAIGVKASDVTNEDLDYYITNANTVVFEEVAIEEQDTPLSGDINGTNSTFSTRHRHIADTDFDCSPGPGDITVYAWGSAGSLDTRETWGVSSINAEKGKVYLSSVPASTYDAFTVDYHHYKNSPTWHMLKEAAKWYAGYDFIFSEYLLIPEDVRRGAVQFEHGRPYEKLRQRYRRAINMFRKNITEKEEHPYPTLTEREIGEY